MAVFSEMRKEGISSSATGPTYSKGRISRQERIRVMLKQASSATIFSYKNKAIHCYTIR
jgi:hypothetical protein